MKAFSIKVERAFSLKPDKACLSLRENEEALNNTEGFPFERPPIQDRRLKGGNLPPRLKPAILLAFFICTSLLYTYYTQNPQIGTT